MQPHDAFQRGQRDASKDRPAIFRSTRAYGIVAEGDDRQADDWSQEDREAYLVGYHSIER